jgi:hypothetical protein
VGFRFPGEGAAVIYNRIARYCQGVENGAMGLERLGSSPDKSKRGLDKNMSEFLSALP